MSRSSGLSVEIIVNTQRRESGFARIRDFLSRKISNLVFNVRVQASKIVINGRPLIKPPNGELAREIRALSLKQLRKLRQVLVEIEAQHVYNRDTHGSFRKHGRRAQPPTPVEISDDVDDDCIYITQQNGTREDEDTKSESSDTKSASSDVESIKLESIGEDEDGHVTVDIDDDKHQSSADEVPEIPFDTKRELRKNRPKAAKGMRSSTDIPSYIIIDEDAVSPRKRVRPTAAKGKRKHPTSNSDLIDLPADVLIERFRDPSVNVKSNSRVRPQAPRGRSVVKVAEALVPAVETKPKMTDVIPDSDTVDDQPVSLDELLCEMGVISARGYKRPEVVQREAVIREMEVVDLEDEAEDEDVDADIFCVPYLPKSQRRLLIGNELPWKM